MVEGKDLADLNFEEELASLFGRLDFALEGFLVNSFFFAVEEEDEEQAAEDEEGFPLVEVDDVDDDFILASPANKVLTTASRSDSFDRDWTADVSSSFLASLSALLDFFC